MKSIDMLSFKLWIYFLAESVAGANVVKDRHTYSTYTVTLAVHAHHWLMTMILNSPYNDSDIKTVLLSPVNYTETLK